MDGADKNSRSAATSVLPKPCGICAAPAVEIKSHIIPKGELRRMKGDSEKFFFLNSDAPSPARWFADRFWEKGLLCSRCEDNCGVLDGWWARFSDERSDAVQNVRIPGPWTLPNVDVEKLTTFLLSVLIRAHLSTLPDFDDLNLEQHFEAGVKAFEHGRPLETGFRLVAQVPLSDEISPGLRVLPRFDAVSAKAWLWFGAFRFVIGFPSAQWSDEHLRLTAHRGGLLVSRCVLEETREYQFFEAELKKRRGQARPEP